MKTKIITHKGGFHSDELFAIALVKKYVTNNVEIIRTRDTYELKKYLYDNKVWVIDVAGQFNNRLKNFDHHQSSFSCQWKGTDIMYSSCGLVWNHLKKSGAFSEYSKWVINEIENKLIKKIDLHDNGRIRWSQAIMFKLFNRESQGDEQFHKALRVAEEHLGNSIYFILEEERNRSRFKNPEYACNGNVVVVENGGFNIIPIISSMTNAKLIVESKVYSDGWSVQSLDSTIETPSEWRGLSGKQLEFASGVDDLIFAHKCGHLVKAKNKKAAIMAAKSMLGL